MIVIAEILKYVLPSLVVAGVVYLMMKNFLQNQREERHFKSLEKSENTRLPLKLQAYERIALFLERIRPSNLALRLRTKESTVSDLQRAMLISIQKEFEHNLAQQIYVSNSLWDIITLAKDETMNKISEIANQSNQEENAEVFSKKISMMSAAGQFNNVDLAIDALKEEIKINLGF